MLCVIAIMVSNMVAVVNWIREHWPQIWGHGTYIEGESGMYVVVPVELICAEFGVTADTLIYGYGDDEE